MANTTSKEDKILDVRACIPGVTDQGPLAGSRRDPHSGAFIFPSTGRSTKSRVRQLEKQMSRFEDKLDAQAAAQDKILELLTELKRDT